ncbi:hypothetical protein D8666_22615 [Ochrobactrum soli]|uniref:hypothetical protein n=1 Tax=Ochrobactrum soli TaxID=2448455 RepID=UPI000EF2679E|nr:hypothetical protein [[Ochrobactrum] soli]RLL64603.1 hypothetical protein D8666_22615 [[Ochrobactrum] soli]
MANNLHISYDLMNPGQNYDAVIDAIKGLGSWAKIHKSFWYVNSTYSAAEARNIVWGVMDSNDKLYVVDATNNEAAWENLSDEVSNHIKNQWTK